MKIARSDINDAVIAVLEVGAIKTVKFLDKKLRVKATKIVYKRASRSKDIEIRLTIGAPNYAERKMIRNALKKDKDFLKNKSLIIFKPDLSEEHLWSRFTHIH